MATITLRAVKGSPLTNAEVDANFTNLNTELGGKADSSSLSAVAISGAYSDLTGKPVNVSSFTNDSGYITSASSITGTASNVTGTVAVANGGTGATSLTSGYLVKGNGTSAISASSVYDNGSSVAIGSTSSGSSKFYVYDANASISTNEVAAGGTGVASSRLKYSTNHYGIYVGSVNAMVFYDYGASAERMRINSAGNVGIGTSSPEKKLVVSDAGNIGFEISPNDAAQGYTRLLNYNRATGAYTPVRYEGSTQTWYVGTAGTTRAMDIDSSGNVGIGTTTPSSLGLLAAYKNTTGFTTVAVANNTATSANDGAKFSSFYGGTELSSIGHYWDGSGFYGRLYSYGTLTFVSGSTPTERMRIDASGNLLVGTTSALGKFVVSGNSVVLDSGNVGHQVVTKAQTNLGVVSAYSNQTGGMALSLETTPSGGSATERMRITSDGNVGIGTSSPGAKLRVLGTSGSPQFGAGTGGNAVFVNAFDSNPIYMTASVTDSTAFGFGAASNIPLFFMTNNTERARIDTSGNVGIGTSSPKARLQASAAAQKNAPTLGSAADAPFYLSNIDPSYGLVTGVNASDGHVWLQAQRTDGTATAYNITLNEAGGDVGIGTSSPGAKLDVKGLVRSSIGTGTGAGGAGYAFYQFGTSATASENWHIGAEGDGSFRFYNQGFGAGLERMRIDSSGNVGIGTSSPTSKLDVVGNVNIGASLSTGTGVSTGDARVEIGANRTGSGVSYIDLHGVASSDYESRIIRYGGANGSMDILNNGTGAIGISQEGAGPLLFKTTATERMRIDSSGNVGIGISSPVTKLDVSGSVSQNVTTVSASDIDCSAGNYFIKTATGALTWTVTNVPANRAYSFILELTNGGTGTQTWFSGIKWPGGTAPTLTTSGVDVLGFITDDGGTTWRGVQLMKDSK